MSLSGPALPVANYGMNAGTAASDLITGVGAQIALAGDGDDILSAQIIPGADGVTPLIPWLVGGANDDSYYITPGNHAVVADLAGGNDALYLDGFKFKKVQIRKIDRRHALISAGTSSVLVVDPSGKSDPNNAIEKLIFKDKTMSGKQLFKQAKQDDRYWGKSTLAEQISLGNFALNATGVEPDLFNGYLSSASYNNSLVF